MPNTIQKNNLFFRQLLFLGILIALALIIGKQLGSLIGSFLGAITLYIVFRSTLFKLTDKYHWKPWLAALLLIVTAALVLMGLLFGIFELVAKELQELNTAALTETLRSTVNKVSKALNITLVPENLLHETSSYITKAAGAVVNTTYSFAINILMMLLVLYFMLSNGHKLEKTIEKYMPFKGKSREMLTAETTSIIYSNAIGVPVMMISQGVAAGLVYWLFGLNDVIFWAFITAVCGLIPMVGTIIISVPLGVSLIIGGRLWGGLALMACGLFVIANVDNLVRIIFNQKMTNTHPLVVIFGVILGIPLFGFWGIIFGPLFISVFLLLVKIYYLEFRLTPEEASNESDAAAEDIATSARTTSTPDSEDKQ